MTRYPAVLDEFATLDLVVSGKSIARYGDGEFKLCHGGSIKSQLADHRLGKRLKAILRESGDCLVGIPNIHSETPKTFWKKYAAFSYMLRDRRYVSSFITRPDSAPWINTDQYWRKLELLWHNCDVTLVRGSTKSFTAELLQQHGAGIVTEIVAPRYSAWNDYDDLMRRIGTPRRALLCLGPTATVMAVDLCAKGVHAIDCGHAGMFAKKWWKREPMDVTESERDVDRIAREVA